MNKILLTAAVAMCTGFAYAADVTLDVKNATDFVGTYTAEVPAEGSNKGSGAKYQPLESLKLGDYTFAFANTGTGTEPAFYYPMSTSTTGVQTIRVYNGNTMTITAPEGATMGTITLVKNGSPKAFTVSASVGSAAQDDSKNVVWTNTEGVQSVTLTFTGTMQIKEVQISGEGGTVTPPVTPPADNALFDVNFKTGMGGFTFEQGTVPEGLSYVWSQGEKFGLVASGYKEQPFATDAWAISPVVELKDVEEPVFSFTQAANMFKLNGNNIAIDEALKFISVNVREENGEWVALNVPNQLTSLSWTFVNSGEIDLSAYIGKKIQIGFHYTSSADVAGTWEISDAKIAAKGGGTVTPPVTPPATTDYPILVNNATEIDGEFAEEKPAVGDGYPTAAHYQPLSNCVIDNYYFSFSSTSENANQQPALYLPMSTSTTGNSNFRVYNGSSMTIQAPEGVLMTAIAIDGSNADTGLTVTADKGAATLDGNKLAWVYEEGVNTLKLSFNKKYRMYGFNITTKGTGSVEGVEEAAPVYVNGNNIVAPAGAQIYTLSGIRVNGDNLAAGLYIVRTANKTVKVIVK